MSSVVAEQPPDSALAGRGVRLFARTCYDLVLLIALALLVPLLPLPLLRVPLGLATVLLGPGYVLQAALFVRRREMDAPTRLAVSFGLSVAILPVLALILDVLPWGIRAQPMVIALVVWLTLWSVIAVARRWLSSANEVTLPPRLSLSTARRLISARLLLAIGLLMCVIGGVGWTLARSRSAPPPTAFYALGADDLAESFPRTTTSGQPIEIRLGIVNREGATMRYRIEARAGTTQLAQIGPIEVVEDATWQQPLQVTLQQPGDDQPIDLLLYRERDNVPYRQLRLWIDVRTP